MYLNFDRLKIYIFCIQYEFFLLKLVDSSFTFFLYEHVKDGFGLP
jgi:hypothetical protein